MLTLGEDMVAVAVHQKGMHEIMRIAEIPEDKRDPKTPKRLQLVLSKEALAKFPNGGQVKEGTE
ncbi:hypothetical protein D3C71_2205410 [compost metagenome]